MAVWYYVKDLQIYDKETETQGKKGEKKKKKLKKNRTMKNK
jgi:hypothetical protein